MGDNNKRRKKKVREEAFAKARKLDQAHSDQYHQDQKTQQKVAGK